MSVTLIEFDKAPLAGCDVPVHSPSLGGEVKGRNIVLSIYGGESNERGRVAASKLTTALNGLPGVVGDFNPWPTWTIPFEGQKTYDLLKGLYKSAVGVVVPYVQLQTKPSLTVEGAAEGWTILKLGGAEHAHFDKLVGRLQAAGCEAEAITGRDGCPAVRFSFKNPNELDELIRLKPIIKGDASA